MKKFNGEPYQLRSETGKTKRQLKGLAEMAKALGHIRSYRIVKEDKGHRLYVQYRK